MPAPPNPAIGPVPLRIVDVSLAGESGGEQCVTIHVQIGTRERTISYRSATADLAPSPDAAVAACLMVAMSRGAPLIVERDVSARLLSQLPKLQDIFHVWERSLQRVEIQGAKPRPRTPEPGRRSAALFTGGVDSFYTILKHRDEIEALLFVADFDKGLFDAAKRELARKRLTEAATALGKPLVWIESDLRRFLEAEFGEVPFKYWGATHGSALASVAHVLSPPYERVFLSSTFDYREITPWGSHPMTDPLWSTESTQIVHDGCESNRVEKIARIADEEIVRKTLRVCVRQLPDVYNCGRCEKCLRTMISLRALGVLEHFETFPHEIDLAAVRKMKFRRDVPPRFLYQNLQLLRDRGGEKQLVRAIEDALDGKKPARRLVARLRRRLGLARPHGET